MFREVNSKVSFPRLEEDILRFWKERGIFGQSIEARQGGQRFVFYEGPPTANGSPGVHHVLARLYKDAVCRYKTMQGYHVPRKAGWDTHGLPVELEVERDLALASKAQIEEYGVARFNDHCRQSVLRYIGEWEVMTERLGYWLDMEHPYVTLDSSYTESCWWIIKQLWDKGLIYQGYKVTPHCPRCGTTISSHEVAQGYEDAEDPSVYIKFKLARGSLGQAARLHAILSSERISSKPAFLLAWTTTPWTLPGNTALAVAPHAEYSVMEGDHEHLILARVLVDRVGLEGYKEVGVVSGDDLVDLEYEPLFNPHEFAVQRLALPTLHVEETVEDLTYAVVGADFVSLDEGTGIVHIAPAFGEIDFEIGMGCGLAFVQPVDLEGRVTGTYPFAGKFVKDADPLILDDLSGRGLLFRSEMITHTYPFCWRCETPLVYYAKRAWYIRTTAVKQQLISGNAEINWYPEHIKHGRFGDWLENNIDWAFSRERYWGTPLNIWRCSSCARYECVGSVDDLKAQTGIEGVSTPLDLHRPHVDEITFACPDCGGRMLRVPEVADCWFDSGAMPVAQWHYPFENEDEFRQSFPADFICEAVDQTRGWFYSLHALSTLLFNRPCFRNVICLGFVVDEQGEKMSTSRGNVVDPRALFNGFGADALRWYMLASATGDDNRRFSTRMLEETIRKFLLTLWNTYSFFTLYANIDSFVPRPSGSDRDEPTAFTELDSWVNSELNRLVSEVSGLMDSYNLTAAARRIEGFVDNLSNWYVRRNRRRFWKGENDADKLAAYTTLYRSLVTLSQLLAPLVPFVAEELYQNLVRSVDPTARESVHLTDFPVADETKIDDQLTSSVELAMKVSSLGRFARAKAGIKVRQPLGEAVVAVRTAGERQGLESLAAEVKEELNVKRLVVLNEADKPGDSLCHPDMPGYSVADDARYWVAVSTELTPELIAEGVSRELIRHLQNMRRSAGFDITDHIITYCQTDEPVVRQVIDAFAGYIKQETLSQELTDGPPPEDAYREKHRIGSSEVSLAVMRAKPQ
ncbi:MAG: isoleucine--tRNA ligase [Dehalococcoidia bacterium]|nr:isoleucine--tRNA ligase [Dehalococcoidia bacterium]